MKLKTEAEVDRLAGNCFWNLPSGVVVEENKASCEE